MYFIENDKFKKRVNRISPRCNSWRLISVFYDGIKMRSDSVSDRKQKRYDRMISSTPATVQAYRQAGLPSGGWSYKDVGGPLLVCNASGRWSARLTRAVEPVGDSVLAGSLVHWGIYQTVGRSVGLGTVAETRRRRRRRSASQAEPARLMPTFASRVASAPPPHCITTHGPTDGRTTTSIATASYRRQTDRPTAPYCNQHGGRLDSTVITDHKWQHTAPHSLLHALPSVCIVHTARKWRPRNVT